MQEAAIAPITNETIADGAFLAGMEANLTDPMHVHLMKAGPGSITPATVKADFTEAAFAGYAIKNIAAAAWAHAVSPNGNAVVIIANVLWISGAVVAPGETILGYFVTDDTNADLYWSEYFPAPVEITNPGQVIDLLVQLPFLMVGSIG